MLEAKLMEPRPLFNTAAAD